MISNATQVGDLLRSLFITLPKGDLPKPENRLRAIRLYCLGVREDFPTTATWMNNILKLAGFEDDIEK